VLYLIPSEVVRYIERMGLYRNGDGGASRKNSMQRQEGDVPVSTAGEASTSAPTEETTSARATT
jgi:hypothetical protein